MRYRGAHRRRLDRFGLRRYPTIGLLLVVSVAFGSNASAQGLRAIAVPWLGDPSQQHQAYDGGALLLHGVARVPSGCSLVSASWDPGDGSGPQSVSIADPRALELEHVYQLIPGTPITPYVATLTVTDDCGASSSDNFRVVVRSSSLAVEANMALDRGLWYLHKTMQLDSIGGIDTGYWWTVSPHSGYPTNVPAATAAALLALQVNGHFENGDDDEDPYVDDVKRGLAHLMTALTSLAITDQTYTGGTHGTAGTYDPEMGQSGANDLALQATASARPVYIGGQIINALVATCTPSAVAMTGDTDVVGRTYGEIVQDLLDAYAWGQVDTGAARGGWRYNWNSEADNSACQWWGIGGLAAEELFGSVIPDYVREHNLDWLEASQIRDTDGTESGADGRFGYTSATYPGYLDVNDPGRTASGMVQLIMDGVARSDPRFSEAEHFMTRHWSTLIGNNRLYGMFAAAKAFREALPTPIDVIHDEVGNSIDWYASDTQNGDPIDGLARHLVSTQGGDGSWIGGQWASGHMGTSWACVILSPTIFDPCFPVAVCLAEAEVTGAGEAIEFSGESSFHTCSALYDIVTCEWDFDGDGVFEVVDDCTVSHSFDRPGSYEVALRVWDNAPKPASGTSTCTIEIVPPPIPPNSDPGGPYHFCMSGGEPFVLDGTNSSDPDGVIVDYAWDFMPQPLDLSFDDATTVTVDVTAFVSALPPGSYDVALRVVDDAGLDNTDFTTLTVYAPGDCPSGVFIRGDANSNLIVDISDSVFILNELFQFGTPTTCFDAADVNDDGVMDISDPVYLLDYLFLAGFDPPPPFPTCGLNPTGIDNCVVGGCL